MAARSPAGPVVALLIRHGTTATTGKVLPGRAPGLHLSDKGRRQANRVAERIAALEQPPTAVYASPLERTLETARPIAKAIGCRVRMERGLVECDVGEWTGTQLSRLRRRKEWRAVISAPSSFRFPGGESFAEMQLRMTSTLDRLAQRHAGERIVVVSHADPIKAAVAATAGVPIDLFQRLVVSPCSVTALIRGPGAMHVLCVNATSSLSELVLS